MKKLMYIAVSLILCVLASGCALMAIRQLEGK